MRVYVEMPIGTPFKAGDVVLERGYEIKTTDGPNAAHEDVKMRFFRPASTDLIEGTATEKTLLLAARLKSLAEEIENLG